jgi:hypothetical protein
MTVERSIPLDAVDAIRIVSVAAAGDDAADAAAIAGTWVKITSVPFGSGVVLPHAIAALEMFVVLDPARSDRNA